MQKYYTQKEVSWRDILGIIRWAQKVSLNQAQWAREVRLLSEEDGSLKNLRTSCVCSRQLRRFLGRSETKLDYRAMRFLESLEADISKTN